MHEKILELAIKGLSYTMYFASACIFGFTVYGVATAESLLTAVGGAVVGLLMTCLAGLIGAGIGSAEW